MQRDSGIIHCILAFVLIENLNDKSCRYSVLPINSKQAFRVFLVNDFSCLSIDTCTKVIEKWNIQYNFDDFTTDKITAHYKHFALS